VDDLHLEDDDGGDPVAARQRVIGRQLLGAHASDDGPVGLALGPATVQIKCRWMPEVLTVVEAPNKVRVQGASGRHG
jgi:hypothetical protein